MIKTILITTLAVLLFVVAGCNTGGSPATPTATPVAKTEAQPTAPATATLTKPTPAVSAENNATPVSGPTADAQTQANEAQRLAILNDITSYRVTLAMKIEGKDSKGTAVLSGMEMQGEETRNPASSHFSTKTTGTGVNPFGDIDTYQVGSATYMYTDGKWTKYTADVTGPSTFGELVPTDDVATAISFAKRIGNENMNGRSTVHYRFDLAGLRAADAAAKKSGESSSDDWTAGATDAQMDVWLDAKDSFMVKYIMVANGTFDQDGEKVTGTTTMTYELKDINSNFTITVPAEAIAATK